MDVPVTVSVPTTATAIGPSVTGDVSMCNEQDQVGVPAKVRPAAAPKILQKSRAELVPVAPVAIVTPEASKVFEPEPFTAAVYLAAVAKSVEISIFAADAPAVAQVRIPSPAASLRYVPAAPTAG